VVAVTFSGFVNEMMSGFLQHVITARTLDSWAAALIAPVNEEFYKGLGLVVIYLMARREIDNVMDGIVYGAMIGLGFQVVENIQYFVGRAADLGGAADAVVSMFFLRVVVSGLYSHMLFTGFVGFGFAYFVTQKGRGLGRRMGVLAGCCFLAWAAHFVWNSPWLEALMAKGTGAFVGALLLKGVPFLILLVLLGVFARRREKMVFGRLMRSEVGSDAVSQGEFYVLQSGHRRREALRHMGHNRGAQARAVFKRLMREQINLALLHTRVPAGDHPALEAQRQVVRMLKSQLASIGH
jgi:RsiW-degrading membrane proteinase PrsW (M82 family)